MKCIKEKCPYYSEHPFYGTYFVCDVYDERSFKIDSDIDCIIDEAIAKYEQRIKYMKDIKRRIENV